MDFDGGEISIKAVAKWVSTEGKLVLSPRILEK